MNTLYSTDMQRYSTDAAKVDTNVDKLRSKMRRPYWRSPAKSPEKLHDAPNPPGNAPRAVRVLKPGDDLTSQMPCKLPHPCTSHFLVPHSIHALTLVKLHDSNTTLHRRSSAPIILQQIRTTNHARPPPSRVTRRKTATSPTPPRASRAAQPQGHPPHPSD